MAKAKKLGAQQVMFWELLQKVREPKGLSWEPQATGLLLGSSLECMFEVSRFSNFFSRTQKCIIFLENIVTPSSIYSTIKYGKGNSKYLHLRRGNDCIQEFQ